MRTLRFTYDFKKSNHHDIRTANKDYVNVKKLEKMSFTSSPTPMWSQKPKDNLII